MLADLISTAIVPSTLQQSSLIKSLCQVFKKRIFVYTYYLMILMCTYTLEAEIPSSKLNWPMPAKHRNLSQGNLWSSHPSPPKKMEIASGNISVSCFVCSHCSMNIHGLTKEYDWILCGDRIVGLWEKRVQGSPKQWHLALGHDETI